ncbi:sodium:proton exchanger [Candidatus Tenderia electrophaga]|jgi:NhaP-type Na+/H+ or K+/H+ antiporter|uniref:Sodium:proton exchanger n=1 Tax=Candidatus Tenderia electrophaga TaxID=1748243 RepID=A0A0S2T9R2_9GAMM|nr:sodium:proton exchanger [Candidatus Tenderia electrophaga]
MDEHVVIALVLIAALGIGAQWLAWRVKLPAIILLIVAGVLAGPVAGWINPSEDLGDLLHPFIAVSVAIILFEGGLNLRLHEYRETGVDVKRLVTVGLVLTWGLGSISAHYIAGLSWAVALTLGAIIVVTGPTVIMPLLKQAKLKRRPAALLKWEGIINDPVGALLAVLVFEYFVSAGNEPFAVDVILTLALVLVAATAFGAGTGFGLGWLFRHGHVPEFLKSPVMLAAVLALYAVVNHFQSEAGLMAVTVAGIVLANQKLRSIEELRRFKEYITIFLVSCVFIILTANMELASLQELDWRGAAWLALVIFVIRPLAVYLATVGTGIDWRERLLISWIAPRGIVAAAVAGLFAPRLIDNGYADAAELLPLVFTLITATVVLHGLSIGFISRRLDLAAGKTDGLLIVGASPWSVGLAQVLQDLEIPTIVSDAGWNHLRAARMSGLRTHHGHILSERAEQTLEIHEISHLLAATNNEAYNALVCTRFAPELGSDKVFQLPYEEDDEEAGEMARTVRGKIVLEDKHTYDDLMQRHYAGWGFHQTHLTEDFGYQDFIAHAGPQAIPVALVTDKKRLGLFPLQETEDIGPGDVVISYQKQEDTDNTRDARRG